MLYTKDGYPDINEIVVCTVTKIYGNTTFVYLDEYEKEGVLTISEIAPGRIRNLRDHVTENKKIICKVLRVDEKQNRIDVSLRRVSIPVMKAKQEELKKEEFSERMYLDVAKELSITKDDLFERTYEPIFEEYLTVFEALYAIMIENELISMFTKLNDKERAVFVKLINDRIRPEEVVFKENFTLSSTEPEGINIVMNNIKIAIEALNYKKVDIIYVAAGKYQIVIKADDMKTADKIYNNFKQNLEKTAKENKLELKFNK